MAAFVASFAGLYRNHSPRWASAVVQNLVSPKHSSSGDLENWRCRRSGLWLFTSWWNVARNMPRPVRTIITRSRKRPKVTRIRPRSILFDLLTFLFFSPLREDPSRGLLPRLSRFALLAFPSFFILTHVQFNTLPGGGYLTTCLGITFLTRNWKLRLEVFARWIFLFYFSYLRCTLFDNFAYFWGYDTRSCVELQ